MTTFPSEYTVYRHVGHVSVFHGSKPICTGSEANALKWAWDYKRKYGGLISTVGRCETELGDLADGIGRIVAEARKGDRLDAVADRADNLDALGESRQGELFG